METTNGSLNRKLRMALVGGGQGAFIGRVHATAAVMRQREFLWGSFLFLVSIIFCLRLALFSRLFFICIGKMKHKLGKKSFFISRD